MTKLSKSMLACVLASLSAVHLTAGGCAALSSPTTDLSKQALGKTDPVFILYSCELTKSAGDNEAATEVRNYLLSVRYPHAAAKPGYARVELVIEDRAHNSTSSEKQSLSSRIGNFLPGIKLADGVQEAWSLDIPQKAAQQGLDELKAAGFFASQPPLANVPTTVIVDSGKQTTGKRWQRVNSLDRLIDRVRQEGTLASHLAAPVDIEAMLERAQLASNSTTSILLSQPASEKGSIERLPAIY